MLRIGFDFDSAQLTAASRRDLDRVADALADRQMAGVPVTLEGHTERHRRRRLQPGTIPAPCRRGGRLPCRARHRARAAAVDRVRRGPAAVVTHAKRRSQRRVEIVRTF